MLNLLDALGVTSKTHESLCQKKAILLEEETSLLLDRNNAMQDALKALKSYENCMKESIGSTIHSNADSTLHDEGLSRGNINSCTIAPLIENLITLMQEISSEEDLPDEKNRCASDIRGNIVSLQEQNSIFTGMLEQLLKYLYQDKPSGVDLDSRQSLLEFN